MTDEQICPYMGEQITEFNGNKIPEGEYCKCNARGVYCPIFGIYQKTTISYCNKRIALLQHEANKSLEQSTETYNKFINERQKSLTDKI